MPYFAKCMLILYIYYINIYFLLKNIRFVYVTNPCRNARFSLSIQPVWWHFSPLSLTQCAKIKNYILFLKIFAPKFAFLKYFL